MKKFSTIKLVRAAIIAGLYAALTIILAPISYGPVQFRVAECLCILAFFYVEAIPGLTIGCFIANLFGNGALDIVLGTFATFLSSLLAYIVAKRIKNKWLKYGVCSSFNIVINAILIPFVILAGSNSLTGYFMVALEVGAGQLGVALTFGMALYFIILHEIKKEGHNVFRILE